MKASDEKSLNDIRPGKGAVVLKITVPMPAKRRLADLGLTPGVQVQIKRSAPFGNPIQLHLRGYDLSIRREQAKQIRVRPLKGRGEIIIGRG